MEGLEKSLDLDRERQLAALREKLEAKRGQRLDEQKRKQELSLQKELLEQKKELEHVQNKQVCDFVFSFRTHCFGICIAGFMIQLTIIMFYPDKRGREQGNRRGNKE